MRLVWSSSKAYLGYRACTSIFSLVFAFIYSRSLGVENRSIIAFVMTANSLTWIVVTSGTTLTLRKLKPSASSEKELRSFFSLYLLEVLISFLIFSFFIFSYSFFKNYIPLNLFLGIFAYFLTSGLHLISVEILLAFDRFKASGLLDFGSILIQIAVFLVLYKKNLFSIANTALTAFTLSYLIIFILSLGYLRLFDSLRIGFNHPKYFYNLTKGHHSIGISIGVMDRLDRLIIGYLLPTNVLGRYAVMTGMLSVFRFVPDSISKLLVAKNLSISNIFHQRKVQFGILLVTLVATLSIASKIVILLILGENWLLPMSVTVFYLAQECFRSAFQIQANRRIVQGFVKEVHLQAISTPIVSTILALVLIPFLGIYGIPLAISITFISSLTYLKRFEKNE